MITHYDIIVNIMQVSAYEKTHETTWRPQSVTGVIPFTHGYGVEIGHLTACRGETLVVLPRFDMQMMLSSIQRFGIERLYLVCLPRPRCRRREAVLTKRVLGAAHHRGLGDQPVPL